MKILFAIKTLDNIQGGAERVLTDITSGLADKGHNISILSFDQPKGKAFYPLNKKVKRIPLGVGDVTDRATFREVFSRMMAIRKAAIRMQPDVVIAFMHSTFIPASFAMIGTGVPIIASEHIVPDHYNNRKWEYILLLISRFFVKKITVLSQSIIDSYSPILRSKMIAVANPVYATENLSDPRGQNVNRKTILNVGRLTHQKNQEALIKSFSALASDYPDWDLKIFGNGELKNNLENIVKHYNLGKRVFLPGTTTKIDIEYQKAHIFALPSKYESFGLATAEAMAHGLPTIGFASCPGTNELIINDQNGLLVDGNDQVKALENGLRKLMDSAELRVRLGQEGLKTIEPFHPRAIVENWETLTKEALK